MLVKGNEVSLLQDGKVYEGTLINVSHKHYLLDTHDGAWRMLSVDTTKEVQND